MSMDHRHGIIEEVIKSAPPVAVTGLTLFGVPLSQWVYVLTIIWLVIQIGTWGYDRFIKERD